METKTTKKPVFATFYSYKGEWMVKTSRRLTGADDSQELRTVMGGKQELRSVTYLEVTLKSGATKTVEILEYEASFPEKNGKPEAHLYSFRHAF